MMYAYPPVVLQGAKGDDALRKLTRLLAVTALLVSPPGAAQYPAKPIRLLMPFPAGAAADTVVRIVPQPLSQVFGQPVLVDNKPGADGAIEAELADPPADAAFPVDGLGHR